jgi:hypothetical protein
VGQQERFRGLLLTFKVSNYGLLIYRRWRLIGEFVTNKLEFTGACGRALEVEGLRLTVNPPAPRTAALRLYASKTAEASSVLTTG